MAGSGKGSGKGKGLSGQALKQFRSDVAKLKKKGIVSGRVDARKQSATKYMQAKVRKYRDVLDGTAIAVPAPRNVRDQYTTKGVLEARGKMLIAPREFENQRARLKKGLVHVSRALKNGTEEYVILPFRPVDMPDLINQLKADPTLDGLKREDEMFAFRLFGHNSSDGFFDMEELVDHVERNYKHLFNGSSSSDAVKHITFQRFRNNGSTINPNQSTEPKLDTYMPRNKRGQALDGRPEGSYEMEKKRRAAYRKAQQRDNETDKQRASRLLRQKIRQSKHRAKTKR